MTSTKKIPSPLKGPGQKSQMVDKFLPLIPPHRTFVDHTCRGLSLLLAIDPEGRSEIVNDLCGEVTNFWEVMKDESQFAPFRKRVEATPFSEIDYLAALAMADYPPLMNWLRAWGFFVRVRQSMGGMQKSFAPISTSRTRGGMNEQVSAWLSAVDGLEAVHRRLRRVMILNTDILDSISRTDAPDTLHFADPPYMHETRQSKSLYQHEFTNEQHESLLKRLLDVKGKFMLCGYPSALYAKYAAGAGWRAFTFAKPNSASKKRVKETKQENVWTNYDVEAK